MPTAGFGESKDIRVVAGDNGLKRKIGQSLKDGEARSHLRALIIGRKFEDQIRRDMLRLRRAVFVKILLFPISYPDNF